AGEVGDRTRVLARPEVDVFAVFAEPSHHRAGMLGEGAEERVVAGLLPEAVDVHPEASGAGGEGRRVLGHAGEGTSEQVDGHSGQETGPAVCSSGGAARRSRSRTVFPSSSSRPT